ncbi:flavodoxin family protein [Aquimarina sp. BL5]|uniref:NAD(P)H-dependent oxidoreductase n=1 Tax=Aquimarina sp. BL5 TaxID=1714860 RepID=UPI000E5489C1|nr:NAD(P)H-dependent oxidoreductase [Aquimarina sp. BL5]AXT49720.1 flavodoxin family protein [Aquimarina sp. BL5]RKM89900.1 flavodoxin family protein [Aquimarina sp. BL5]
MKVLIIYCHPSKKSYTYEILQQLELDLKKERIEFQVSDLYAMNFKTDMSEEEYRREGFANLDIPIANDVKKEHQKIAGTDCIIFLYPVWWSDCPAKLKGWFDRVYAVGYAYGENKEKDNTQMMKRVPQGVVICTAGHPNKFLEEIGIARSMRNVMLDDRLGKRFNKKAMIILGGTLDKEKVRLIHAERINSTIKSIKKNLD